MPLAEMARIVFNAFASANFFDHLQIIHGALLNALQLDIALFFFEKLHALFQFLFNRLDRLEAHFFRRYVVGTGIDRDSLIAALHFACEGIDFADALDVVAEQSRPV